MSTKGRGRARNVSRTRFEHLGKTVLIELKRHELIVRPRYARQGWAVNLVDLYELAAGQKTLRLA